MAVHERPAAFDGPDGLPYSVDIATDATGEPARPFGAYLLFLQWRRMGPPGVDAHIETEFLAYGQSAESARAGIGAMTLHAVKEQLDTLVQSRSTSGRKWYDVMRDGDAE